MKQRTWWTVALLLTWAFCIFVETYDVYWSIKLQEDLIKNEQNPIGAALIRADGGSVALFMSLKMAGLIVVLSSMPLLVVYARRFAFIFIPTFLMSRLMLLFYLEYGHMMVVWSDLFRWIS